MTNPTETLCGHFDVISADPPWMYQKNPGSKGGGDGAPGVAEREYRTMTNEEIAALPVRNVAADDAHLFMWITNPGIYGGRFSDVTPADIAAAWGFEFRTVLTWVKTVAAGRIDRGGMGWYFRGATEHVLYATRGRAGIPAELREPNVFLAAKGAHSVKPQAFYDLVERVTPGANRLEMFARTPRPGWTVWGDQADGSALTAPVDPDQLELFGGAA
jgi:N6-adenosine-specific RNA methylase IME4